MTGKCIKSWKEFKLDLIRIGNTSQSIDNIDVRVSLLPETSMSIYEGGGNFRGHIENFSQGQTWEI